MSLGYRPVPRNVMLTMCSKLFSLCKGKTCWRQLALRTSTPQLIIFWEKIALMLFYLGALSFFRFWTALLRERHHTYLVHFQKFQPKKKNPLTKQEEIENSNLCYFSVNTVGIPWNNTAWKLWFHNIALIPYQILLTFNGITVNGLSEIQLTDTLSITINT